jgi:hypothetical protein
MLGIFFGIGTRVQYPKTKLEQDRVARKRAGTITTSRSSRGSSAAHGKPCPTTDACLVQLPGESKVIDNAFIVKYVFVLTHENASIRVLAHHHPATLDQIQKYDR